MTTTHDRSTAPSPHRHSAAGPAANLIGLPDTTGVSFTTPAEVDAHLGAVEAARQRQLDAMPPTDRDPVAAAYRATVERILEEVRTARHRLAAGRYGVCTRCDGRIALPQLELRPWAATCAPCADRDGTCRTRPLTSLGG